MTSPQQHRKLNCPCPSTQAACKCLKLISLFSKHDYYLFIIIVFVSAKLFVLSPDVPHILSFHKRSPVGGYLIRCLITLLFMARSCLDEDIEWTKV